MLICLVLWWNCLPKKLFNDPTSTVLTDKKGDILGARIAADGQWRFPPRKKVPEKFKKAIIQFEDRDFYDHMGFSFKAFGRAISQNIKEGRIVSGGSTISMQVIRLSRKGKSRSVFEKIMEVTMATRLETKCSKSEILAMYASNAPMGGNVVGIDAAAWRYFGTRSENLSWSEACVLAILPNAPSLIRPGKNRKALIAKRNRLLKRLHEVGELDELELQLAISEPIPSAPPNLPNDAPHLMDHFIKNGQKGNWIVSSLDYDIQKEVDRIVAFNHKKLAQNEIQNAAVIVIEVETGKVIAYKGNTDGDNPNHGNAVDVIRAPRSTGSILKPFLYGAMIHDGEIMPHQLIEDVPVIISGYSPKNYNGKYDGAVPASRALSRSLNVPIVKMLKQYGVQKFHRKLNQFGLTTINRPAHEYGLSLVLGGAEASLWDLCNAYANMARTLNKHTSDSDVSYEEATLTEEGDPKKNDERYLMSASAAWCTFQAMLEVSRPNENQNWEEFASSQKIAWKTGTSFGFRDAWSIGITPKYVVGVWVGNADGEGRPGLIGIEAAAPILFDVFDRLPSSPWFDEPYDEMVPVAVCRQSGFRASEHSRDVDTVMVPESCLNTTACPYSKTVHLDQTGTYRVNSSCDQIENMQSAKWFVLSPIAERYYKAKNPSYKTLPPYKDECAGEAGLSPMDIIYPKRLSRIYIPLQMDGNLSKTIFEASHREDNSKIYWHLDDRYIGETENFHSIEVVPEPGKHVLTLVDQNGQRVSRSFEVLGK